MSTNSPAKERLVLYSGRVGDYDGAYNWVRDEELDNPDFAVGNHEGDPYDFGYSVVEVSETLAEGVAKEDFPIIKVPNT